MTDPRTSAKVQFILPSDILGVDAKRCQLPPEIEVRYFNERVVFASEWPGLCILERFLTSYPLDLDDLQRSAAKLLTHCGGCQKHLGYAIKPRLCDLCKFSAVAFGLGINLDWEMQHNKAVVEFVWNVFRKAVFESQYWADETFFFSMDEDLKQRWGSTTAIRRAALTACTEMNPSIMRWLLSNNASLLHSIKPMFESKLTFEIQDSKEIDGDTFFAFSGSHDGAWHCIIQKGFQVMSGTQFQRNGSLHGAGIYTSLSLLTARKYGSIVGVVEICKGAAKIHNEIVVVPNAKDMRLRYVLVEPQGGEYLDKDGEYMRNLLNLS